MKLVDSLFWLIHAVTYAIIAVLVLPLSLRIYWVSSFVVTTLFTVSGSLHLLSGNSSAASLRADHVASFVSFPLASALLIFSVAIPAKSNDAVSEKSENVSLYASALFLRKTFWIWMNLLMSKGYKSPLNLEQVPTLSQEHKAEKLASLVESKPEEKSRSPVRTTLLRCFWKKVFPPSDYSLQPPTQELLAKDLHDVKCAQPTQSRRVVAATQRAQRPQQAQRIMMSCRTFAVLMVLVVVTGFPFGEGYPDQDLVVRLPGQPKVGFRQYAGYVDVDPKHGRSLFYYFVEADKNHDTKPLTLWLNGGPGCSSIGGGAFTELGPFYPTGDGRGLRINSMSWNKASNLLFVESPAGVGWSYSNTSSDYNTGDEAAASDMLVFLLRWFIKFPELKFRDLFLTGESYAGHYVPQLAEAIHSYNTRSSGFKFNVKGITIGNPLLKHDTYISAMYDFFWSHGMISDEVRLRISMQCDFSRFQNRSKACMDTLIEVDASFEYVNNYDVLLDLCSPSIIQQELRLKKMVTKMSMGLDVCITYERSFYFNLPEVQYAFHANRTRLPYEWSMCSNLVNYNPLQSGIDESINMLPTLKRIIENKTPVWIFSGDQDSVILFLGSRTLVKELANDLNLNVTVPYGVWFHKEQVGGWVTEYGKLLTFATVKGAGHMVPYSQSSRALDIFSSFVRGQRLSNKPHTSLHE